MTERMSMPATPWDPSTYSSEIRAEIDDYDLLQSKLVEATQRERGVASILDLGVGSGETARRVLDAHRSASLQGLDLSPEMLAAARSSLPAERARLSEGRLEDELPEGPFDLVVSALAVHHLEAEAKADLFRRVSGIMTPGGRFVLADVVVPDDPSDARIELEQGYDFPSTVAEQLAWLDDAGFSPNVFWLDKDLAVITADLPARRSEGRL